MTMEPTMTKKRGAPKKAICLNGHDRTTETVDQDGSCKVCRSIRQKKYREANQEKRAKYQEKYRARDREQLRIERAQKKGRVYKNPRVTVFEDIDTDMLVTHSGKVIPGPTYYEKLYCDS